MMNALVREPGKAGSTTTELLFDWRADLERLEAAAEAARRTHNFDPWALAEGECWLDLIEAELVALRRAPRQPQSEESRLLLEDWRQRAFAAVQSLRAVASLDTPQALKPNNKNGVLTSVAPSLERPPA